MNKEKLENTKASEKPSTDWENAADYVPEQMERPDSEKTAAEIMSELGVNESIANNLAIQKLVDTYRDENGDLDRDKMKISGSGEELSIRSDLVETYGKEDRFYDWEGTNGKERERYTWDVHTIGIIEGGGVYDKKRRCEASDHKIHDKGRIVSELMYSNISDRTLYYDAEGNATMEKVEFFEPVYYENPNGALKFDLSPVIRKLEGRSPDRAMGYETTRIGNTDKARVEYSMYDKDERKLYKGTINTHIGDSSDIYTDASVVRRINDDIESRKSSNK